MVQTETQKGREGWESVSKIELAKVETDTMGDKVENGIKYLEISTRKGTRGLISYASVYIAHGGDGFRCKSFAFPDDYMRTFNQTEARCTEKTVKELHAKTMANIEAILADVEAFYNKRKAA